jgi:hypothetical protein
MHGSCRYIYIWIQVWTDGDAKTWESAAAGGPDHISVDMVSLYSELTGRDSCCCRVQVRPPSQLFLVIFLLVHCSRPTSGMHIVCGEPLGLPGGQLLFSIHNLFQSDLVIQVEFCKESFPLTSENVTLISSRIYDTIFPIHLVILEVFCHPFHFVI